MKPFQIILISVFVALSLGGLLMFATFRGFSAKADPLNGGVTVWGTLDRQAFEQVIGDLASKNQKWGTVHYIEKDKSTFEKEFVNSIAEGSGPDLVLLPHDLLIPEAGKLTQLSYDNFSVRDYRNTFVEGTEIFLFPNGFFGIPFAVDPLVMYWNRNIFASSKLAYPPRTWEELVKDTVPAITKRKDNNDITLATIAFGEYANVYNAKSVLLLLMTQAGSKLVQLVNNAFVVRLNESAGTAVSTPADAAIRFFTQFANPSAVTYSWNRGMKSDRDAFLAEELALYFGYASEYQSLRDGNANLNFDIAEVPQGSDETNRKDYGLMYAFTIPKSAKNPSGAMVVAKQFALTDTTDRLVRELYLAPARRDLIAKKAGSPFGDTVYQAALIVHGWLDPNPMASDSIFKEMIETVTSGRAKISDSIENASYQLQKLF